MKKILVFNGHDYIGNALALRLSSRGHEVCIVDTKFSDVKLYQYKAMSYSRAFIEDCVRASSPDTIVVAPRDKFTDISSSVKDTLTVLSALADLPKYGAYNNIFHLSSLDSVTLAKPNTRIIALNLEETLTSSFNDFVTIRLPLVTGPRPSFKDDVLNSAVHQLLIGKEIQTFHRDSKIVISPIVPVLEVVEDLIFKKPTETAINVTGRAHKLGDLFELIKKTIGHGRIIYDDTQILEEPVYVGSFQTIHVKDKVSQKCLQEIVQYRKSQLLKMGYTET